MDHRVLHRPSASHPTMSSEMPKHPAAEALSRATGESDGDVRELLAKRDRAELKFILSRLTDGAVAGDTDLLFAEDAPTNITRTELQNLIVFLSEQGED